MLEYPYLAYLPDEMILIIIEYLDSFSIVSSAMRISKQWRSLSTFQFKSLQLSDRQVLNFDHLHLCSSLKSLTCLDLRNCSIGKDNFIKLLRSGNLLDMKSLFISSAILAVEVGNIYNEYAEKMMREAKNVEYCLPKLTRVHVENICKVNLINPLEYSSKIKNGGNEIKSSGGELFGKSQIERVLKEYLAFPSLFPFLKSPLRPPRNIFLFGAKGSGKSFILNAFAESFPCNTIEPIINCFDAEMRDLFVISELFGYHILSLLIFRTNPITLFEDDSENQRRLRLHKMLVSLDGYRNKEANFFTFLCSNTPWNLEPGLRRRFYKRVEIKLPSGDSLVQCVKYHLERRFGVSILTTSQIEQISQSLEGYSPFEIEQIINSLSFYRNEFPNSIQLFQSLNQIISKTPPLNTESDLLRIGQFAQDFC